MTWFETLTGFQEKSPEHVRNNLIVEGEQLTSKINHKSFTFGHLETPTLGELRARIQNIPTSQGKISVREVVANVQDLHTDINNANALFQAASQFNLLEMISPNISPEQGIGIYDNDPTQGPACATAAGAGTIYRNYFAKLSHQIGQSKNQQIDCLSKLGNALGNTNNSLWQMKNGYALATHEGLIQISQRLLATNENERDSLRQLLQIGLQWNTQVTLNNCTHKVSQAYCSALPVAYSPHPSELWESFARLILEASYEATLCAAILNYVQTGNNRVFLTTIGGGAFGNETEWIMTAMKQVLKRYQSWQLEVVIVSYGSPKDYIQPLLKGFS